MNHPDNPEKISQFPVSLTDAVAKAEKLIEEHQAYSEDGQNDSTTLRSLEERAISLFTELQEAVNADIESVSITEIDHLMTIFDQIIWICYVDFCKSKEMARQIIPLLRILRARKNTQHLFGRKQEGKA